MSGANIQPPVPRHEEHQHWQGVVDALTGQVCVIDASGVILAVSGGWRRFGMENGGREIDVGSNYFAVCGAIAGPGSADAQAFVAGVRSVIAGGAPRFSMEYRCDSLTERRWFRLTVTRIEPSDPLRLVVAHEDLTPIRLAEDLATGEAERFRALAALSTDWYWEQDADLRFTRISNGLYPEGRMPNSEFLGRTRREVPGMEWDEAGLTELETLCRARRPFRDFELWRVEHGALRRTYQISGEPLYDDSGCFLGYRGVGRDVTALKTAENARLQETRRFALVLGNLHGATLMVGNEGCVEFVNGEFCDMFGLGEVPDAIVGMDASTMVARIARAYADPAAAVARIRAVVEAGQPVREEEIWLADGRICLRDFVPLEVDGGAGGRLWYHRDVTQQKKARLLLQESEARFRGLAEQAPVMIWMSAADGHYEFVNGTMLAFTGRTFEEQSQVAWTFDCHPEDLERTRAANDAAIAARVPITVEWRRRRQDGEYRWLSASASPRRDADGNFCGYIGVLADITDLKHAERVLSEAGTRLEQRVAERTAELTATVAELESMTSVVSHDLRAPLHRMAGFAGLLAMEEEVRQNATVRDFTGRIRHTAERMEELINRLLDNARLARTAVEAAAVSFDRLVRSYVAEVDALSSERPVEWVIGALPTVHCDPIMARQVAQNLIENAVKYSGKREHPRIEILPIDNPAEHGFLVRDNGVGFSMEHAERLFGVFTRLHSEADFPGVGIGLANVRRIMQKHGGRVWCSAVPGQGATFFVVFPKSAGLTEGEAKGC